MKWAWLGVLAVVVPSMAPAAARYTITNVVTLSGASAGYGEGTNDAGTVVGCGGGLKTAYHAFSWRHGIASDLGTLPGANAESYANSINNSGWAATTSDARVTTSDGGTIGGSRGTVCQNGTRTALRLLGGRDSDTDGVNDAGQVVGAPTIPCPSTTPAHALERQAGTMKPLGTLGGGTDSSGSTINPPRQVAGSSQNAASNERAVDGSGGTITDFGTPAGANSWEFVLNDDGATVGRAEEAAGTRRAFPDDPAVMRSLRSIDIASVAYGVNDSDPAVGGFASTAGQSRAFVCVGGTMDDLDALILPASRWVLTKARGVTEAGRIVGTGTHEGETVAPELKLSPKPTSLVLVGRPSYLVLAGCRS